MEVDHDSRKVNGGLGIHELLNSSEQQQVVHEDDQEDEDPHEHLDLRGGGKSQTKK
jgi:hypothetical protein